MMMRTAGLILAVSALAGATIVDRIAVIVNSRVIKHSDIDRDIRITDYLNAEPLSFSADARRTSAQRLIDQVIIRREVELGNYRTPSPEELRKFLDKVKEQRNSAAMTTYGITEGDLHHHLEWQLTVLNFIDQRFRTAVIVTEADITQYAGTHSGMTPEQINEVLTGERVNKAFDDWLKRARDRARIEYRELELQGHKAGPQA